jgi:3-oxosteroid 1-dehydrogenase
MPKARLETRARKGENMEAQKDTTTVLEESEEKPPFEYETDVLVVGAGAGGFVAAITAATEGMKVLLVESTELVGGCSSMSGGGLWIPNNPFMIKEGRKDSYEMALTYLNTIIGDVGPASSPEKREAYLRQGPEMVKYLQRIGMHFTYVSGYPDYYPHLPGGTPYGRALEGEIFDLKELPDEWQSKIRRYVPLALETPEVPKLNKMYSARAIKTAFAIFRRMMGGKLKGKEIAGQGCALIGRLLKLALEKKAEIWLNSPLKSLVTDHDSVVGAVLEHEGKDMRVLVKKGVILAAGGFAQNQAMRDKYHPKPIDAKWSSASPGDMGGGILAGIEIGADTALMDDAWWGPSLLGMDGKAQFMIWERSNPYSIIVDKSGERFMNESASYVDCGHAMYERDKEVSAIPAYLIFDSNHRNKYLLGSGMPPRMTPKKALESGYLVRAGTLEELALKKGIDSDNLVATVKRFNSFCHTGKDEDFLRGDNAYDRYYSDPKVKPNPNLAPLRKAPFYAMNVYPGDLSTKGGLLADEYARVLRPDGSIINRLYVTGNNAASVMGRTYPGAGSTIGPSMTFAYVAAKHIAEKHE